MAHQTKIREAMAKIKLAQANLASLYDELSQMIPAEKRTKNKEEKAKIRLSLKAKVLG